MSGVSRPSTTKVQYIRPGKDLGLVDPTVEIMQPGGPFPYGEAILTDGAGGYTIAPTLRPYLFSFKIPSGTGVGDTVDCEFNGIATSTVGLVLPLKTNLIAITVVVDAIVRKGCSYVVEILQDPVDNPTVVETLKLTVKDGRKTFRRDLSVELKAGVELAARIRQTTGKTASAFSGGHVGVELEA
jgi:hypothetical protein